MSPCTISTKCAQVVQLDCLTHSYVSLCSCEHVIFAKSRKIHKSYFCMVEGTQRIIECIENQMTPIYSLTLCSWMSDSTSTDLFSQQ